MTDLLRDRYEPLEVVGQGGEGRVLRAWDHLHERAVAVKVRRRGAETAETLAEARVLLGLTPHRLLPLVREDFFAGDDYCMVMDWVEGRSLAQLLQERPEGLELDEVVRHLRQVAEALDHLHSHRPPVVHGDVKPANIVVAADGRAILVDFGISRSGGAAKGVRGTAGYAAPEVTARAPVGPAADVFGLAATAFALVTGGPPSPGSRPRWRALVGDRAHRVELVLRRGLAYDPARRPARASELVAALEERPGGPTNLPLAFDSFVGRESDVGEIGRRLTDDRLVTLVGPGGVGKSRLAVRVGAELLDLFPDGVYLVELASIADPGLVPAEVARTVGVAEQPGQAFVETLGDVLANRRSLLVLDNCEHMVGSVAALVEGLLSRPGGLRVLATSRIPLGAASEVVRRLGPLATDDAAQLFVERAAAARPGDVLDVGSESVQEICRRLDGMPLAIELAAAVPALSVDELLARLDDRFSALGGAHASPSARHRTLAEAVAWSYDALSVPEQALFRRLSVFAGPFTVTAAEGICSGGDVEEAAVASLLESLLSRALVVAREDGRYQLLDTLRAYGAERLGDLGETDTVSARHLEWFRAQAAPMASPDVPGPVAFLDALEADHDNYRAALRWALDQGRPDAALDLALSLRSLWQAHVHHGEARRWYEEIAASGLAEPGRGRALMNAGGFAQVQGDLESAAALLEQALPLVRMAEDPAVEWLCLRGLAETAAVAGRFETARRRIGEAEAVYRRAHPDGPLPVKLLAAKALVAHHCEPGTDAELRICEELLQRARDEADDVLLIHSLYKLGLIAEGRGADARARFLYDEAVWRARRSGVRRWLGPLLACLARVSAADDDPGPERLLLESFDEAARAGTRGWSVFALLSVAPLAARAGDHEAAARFLAAADHVLTSLGGPRRPAVPSWDWAAEASVVALGDTALEAARRAGERLSLDEAVADARAWLQRAEAVRRRA